MLKIEVNKYEPKIEIHARKGDALLEMLSAISAFANVIERENREIFKTMLRMLIEDEDSPLNNIEKYRERK